MGNDYAARIIFDKKCGRRDRVVTPVKITELKGRRIAMDAFNHAHVKMYRANGKVLDATNLHANRPDLGDRFQVFLWEVLKQNADLIEEGITPVWVFDGPPHPEKLVLHDRKDEREMRQLNIDIYENRIGSLSIEDDSAPLVEAYKKELKRETSLLNAEVSAFKSMLYSLGIPYLEMILGDGEEGCSRLVAEGYCAAVYSTDTDNINYGADVYLKAVSKYGRNGNMIFEAVFRDDVMRELGFNERQIMDFFIMCGGDYNESIPGVGGGTAYKLLKQYGCIENIPTTIITPEALTKLRIDVCRRIFAPKQANTLFKSEFNPERDLDLNMERFMKYGIAYLGSKGKDGLVSIFHERYEKMGVPIKGALKKPETLTIELEPVHSFYGNSAVISAGIANAASASFQGPSTNFQQRVVSDDIIILDDDASKENDDFITL